MDNLIDVKNLYKSYGRKNVLHDFESVQLYAGYVEKNDNQRKYREE